MNSFRKRVFSWFAVLAVCVITSSAFPKDAEAILINFNAGSGTLPSYTESGMTFTDPGAGHIHMNANLLIHIPGFHQYSITFGGAGFTLVSLTIVGTSDIAGGSTFTTNNGAVATLPNALGTFLFPTGFTGTSVSWVGSMTIDDLVFNAVPTGVPEPMSLMLLAAGLLGFGLLRRKGVQRIFKS